MKTQIFLIFWMVLARKTCETQIFLVFWMVLRFAGAFVCNSPMLCRDLEIRRGLFFAIPLCSAAIWRFRAGSAFRSAARTPDLPRMSPG